MTTEVETTTVTGLGREDASRACARRLKEVIRG